ncbi:hypothetical protein RHDC4_03366 [Rhodocyclaceae bacterium]|nr:hypothetical protein RHDC4_03366 [Rhodocyclaceae bacterium]
MKKSICIIAFAAFIAACGGGAAHHRGEEFGSADPRHRRDFPVAAGELCKVAQHVLLERGYAVSRRMEGDDIALVGRKEFREDDKQHAVLEFHATCSATAKGAILFATAVESRFDGAASKRSTSVGVPVVAPITFTSSETSEAQVKLGGGTVEDAGFYESFFKAVQRGLEAP